MKVPDIMGRKEKNKELKIRNAISSQRSIHGSACRAYDIP